jgi:hypothetical protein
MHLHITRETHEPKQAGENHIFVLMCRLVLSPDEQVLYTRYVQPTLFDPGEMTAWEELMQPQGIRRSSDHIHVIRKQEAEIQEFCTYVVSTINNVLSWTGSDVVEIT